MIKYNYENIEINNNVMIDDLYNDKYWIHGNSNNDINITIFIITICGHQLQYSLEAINNLNTNNSVLVNVIMNVKPTNKAYNTMIKRCTTEYFVQLDEDMIIYPNSIDIIKKHLFENKKKNVFFHTFKLIDNYLGLGEQSILLGLKLYDYKIMKNYPIQNDENPISQVDKIWHNQIFNDGYIEIIATEIIGFHAKFRKPYDLLLRFGKSTITFMDNNVKKNSGDYCRILKPISKIENLNSIYSILYYHFIILGFDKNKYTNKFNTFEKTYFKYINKNALLSYNITNPNNNIPKTICDFNFKDFMDFFEIKLTNLNEYYVLIGILNALFDNYSYSFDKYPILINEYFSYVFNYNIVIKSKSSNSNMLKNFNCWDNIKLLIKSNEDINNSNSNFIDNLIENDDIICYEYIKNNIIDKTRVKKTILIIYNDIKNIKIHNLSNLYIFVIDNDVEFIKYHNNMYFLNQSLLLNTEYVFYKIISDKQHNYKSLYFDLIDNYIKNDFIIEL